MSELPDVNVAWPHILNALSSRDVDALQKLLWPSGASQDWYESMAPMIEHAAGGYEKSDRALAIFCYEQARNLYLAQAGGATSGGEGMAMMSAANDRGLGRNIWLLRREGS